LNPPVPLAKPAAAAPAASPGALNATLAAAKRAQELGLPAIAVPLYRQLLETAVGAERDALALALTTALLDAGEAAEAQKILDGMPPPHDAVWQLRAGLAALQAHKRDAAQAAWNAIKAEDVAPADRAWYYFLTGALYDTAAVRDLQKANDFYVKAETAATTELSRARFQLAGEQVRLRMLPVPPAEVVDQTLKNFEKYQGSVTGYGIAQSYAIDLAATNRPADAVEFLQRRVMITLPASERSWRDEFNFLIGLIGDASRAGPARSALNQLLETGLSPQRQRQALQLLASASTQEPGRGQFLAELTKLIAAATPHPIKESLLFYRAQLALAAKNYAQAEDDANALLQSFPGSPLRVYAFGVLTGSAWEQGRYRLTANDARAARAELATATDPALIEARARLGVLEAEAWFRAGDADDYRNAAAAYAALVRERPAGLTPRELNDLRFQRVLAEIKSGSANAAQALDEVEADPAFDVEFRWQAEWILARELQTRGDDGIKQAYARVNQLLDAPPDPAIRPEQRARMADLRARMAWLQARLSFEAGEYARTLTLADGLVKQAEGVDARLREEIASTGALLKAQAQLVGLRDEPRGVETLKKLRADFPKSDAAVSSYLIEADYDEKADRIVDAQKLLTKLADDFPDNLYAPYALYQAAVLAEKLGQDDNLKEAVRLIENLVQLVAKFPQNDQRGDLVFGARLKEGELYEKLNQLPLAQQVYQELENKFPHHGDVVRAQLALAKCLNAQASGNPSYLAAAQAKFEQLLYRVDAREEVRVEAGYNLGELLVRRDSPDKAAEVWWRDVVFEFLLKDPAKKKNLLGDDARPNVNGRYWMARTLVRVGDLLEQQGKLEDAKRAWSLILETKLGYDALARVRLARFGVAETKP
jgi:hypothetical protein